MKGVAQHIGTPNPGERGNVVLSGHNDIYGEVFRDLDRLNPGDMIILFTSQRQSTCTVTGTQMVEPTAVEVMAPTPDSRVTFADTIGDALQHFHGRSSSAHSRTNS